MRDYDDLMGLDMYDDGMSGLITADMLRDKLIAAGSAAAGIGLASWLLPMIPMPAMVTSLSEPNQHRVRAGIGMLAGIAAGRGLWNYNRDAAMAVVGGVAGLSLLQLLATYMPNNILKGFPLGDMPGNGELSQSDEALLSAYSNTGALSQLEATSITSARGAFSEFAGPTITNEALMGAVVNAETLGGGNGYGPWLA
jgi:hypothetical protein